MSVNVSLYLNSGGSKTINTDNIISIFRFSESYAIIHPSYTIDFQTYHVKNGDDIINIWCETNSIIETIEKDYKIYRKELKK